MIEKQKLNIDDVIKKSFNYIKSIGKKANLNLENEYFENNLKEIITNPSSNYCDKISLFSEITALEAKKETLSGEISILTTQKQKIDSKINDEETGLEKEKKELEGNIENLTKQKNSLTSEINGDQEILIGENKKGYLGLLKLKAELEDEEKNF